MKKSLLLTLLLLVHVCAAWAADKVITGNVIADDDKQPLIGVSVYVSADDLKKAGSSLMSLGVVTDIDGNFSITVPSGVKKLQLSYIGYTTQQIELKSGQTHYNGLTAFVDDAERCGCDRLPDSGASQADSCRC